MFSRDCREDETILGYYFLLAGEAISFSLMICTNCSFGRKPDTKKGSPLRGIKTIKGMLLTLILMRIIPH